VGPLDLLAPEPPDRWGREPDVNAFVELHNLIAAAESPADVSDADTDRISREHGVDLRTDFRDERVGLYLRLFEAAGSETGFTAAALRRLAPVARVLALAPADVRAVHTRAFGSAVDDALADDCLTVEERLHLYALQQSLGLDETTAAQTVEARAQARLLHAVARALCDGRLAPDEAAAIAEAAHALGVSVPDEIALMLNRAASAWEATAPLPVLSPSIRLSPGEHEHARLTAGWARKRSDSLRDAFAGGVAVSSPRDAFPWDRFMTPMRRGDIVLTSLRLVLIDTERATEYVRLADVRDVTAFSDAALVRLDDDSRRLVLGLGAEAGAFCGLLARACTALPDEAP
jgi:hypothetical protein